MRKKETVKLDKIKAPASAASVNYQSGFNANRQAVNSGQVLSDYEGNAFSPTEGLTDDAQRGVEDLNRGMTDNAQAQMGRQLESQNAQKHMEDQFARSELLQQGLANQAKIHSDINQRAVDQMGLAAQLQDQHIKNSYAVANQMAVNQRAMFGGVGLSRLDSAAENLFAKSLLGGK